MRPKQLTLDDPRKQDLTGHGGYRPGAGRPARRPGIVHHVRRPRMKSEFPAHVTLRVREGLPSLRRKAFVREFQASLAKACERGGFRVVHYSIQTNHVHLIVEAKGKQALGAGMKAIGARLARAVNRCFRRSGPVLDGRYHLRLLKTPKQVRNALAYVLLNVRKHWKQRRGAAPPVKLDAASSGRWFRGWKRRARGQAMPRGEPEVAEPRTWLLSQGWQRHGRIDPAEVPGVARA